MSTREDIPLTSTRAYHIWSCGYSHSSHRLPPSPRIVYSLADTLHSLHRLPPFPHTVYGLVDTLTHCIAYLYPRLPYMALRILSLTARLAHPPPHRASSGGGAPCVTAGDTRAERGETRGKVDSTNFRRRRRRTESVEKVSSISPPRKKLFFVVTLSRKHSTR